MKLLIFSIIVIFCTSVAFKSIADQAENQSAGVDLERINATEAMVIANAWKWNRKDVKSYVDSREVVFQFSDGTVKRIPLPEDKMLVAVAPYMQHTHQ